MTGDKSEWKTRTIVSGLAKFVDLSDMKDSKVLVLSNLKTSKLRGVESEGMVLCASNADHSKVEIVRPPKDAEIGATIQVSKYTYENLENESMNPKSKTYPKIMQGMKCDKNGFAVYEGENGVDFWLVNGEKCKPKTLTACSIS